MAQSSRDTLLMAQAAFMAPVLVAFVIGSLPVLLPILLYRRLTRANAAGERRAVAPVAETRARAEPEAALPLLAPALAAEGA